MFFKKNISKKSDKELIELYKSSSNTEMVGELYRRYGHLVFGSCLKYLKNQDDAKDATLALFEKLMTELKHREIEVFQNWLHTVTKNHCLMVLRSKQAMESKLVNDQKVVVAASDDAADIAELEIKEAGMNKLEEAMKLLNQHQERCVRLFYLEEKSYKDISDQTGYSTNEVKSHIQNGRRNLKNLLTGH